MESRPFSLLATSRDLGRNDLPPELARFYEKNEGIGLQSPADRIVRLCRLSEVKTCAWRDVPIFGSEDEAGWNDFEAFHVGVSLYHDGIYWVRQAPCCPKGSILTIGPDLAGPGGDGPDTIEPSLVLASSFDGWLTHLARYAWFEYGLAPGNLADLPASDQSEMRAYFKVLNPGISWGAGLPSVT